MMIEKDGVLYFYTPKDFYRYVMNYEGELTLKIGMEIWDTNNKKIIGKMLKNKENG